MPLDAAECVGGFILPPHYGLTETMQDLMACERLGIHPFGGRPWDGLEAAEQALARRFDRIRRAQEREERLPSLLEGA